MHNLTLIMNKNPLERQYGAYMSYFEVLTKTLGKRQAYDAIIEMIDVKLLDSISKEIMIEDDVLDEEPIIKELK